MNVTTRFTEELVSLAQSYSDDADEAAAHSTQTVIFRNLGHSPTGIKTGFAYSNASQQPRQACTSRRSSPKCSKANVSVNVNESRATMPTTNLHTRT
jgi:hypothetical protein